MRLWVLLLCQLAVCGAEPVVKEVTEDMMTYITVDDRIVNERLPMASITGPGCQEMSQITAVYEDAVPEAFRVAFEYALHIWECTVASTVEIVVNVRYQAFNFLAAGGPTAVVSPGGNARFQPVALWDALTGNNFDGISPDMVASFSTSAPWDFGLDGNPGAGLIDFVTVALHEVGHGLGIIAFPRVSPPLPFFPGGLGVFAPPMVYDMFVQAGGTDITTIPVGGALGSALSGLSGPLNFVTALTCRLFAPNPFQPGSSYSHLDELTYPPGHESSLMTPSICFGESNHDTGSHTRAILRALGWVVSGPVMGGGHGDPHFALFQPVSGYQAYQPKIPTDGTYNLFSSEDLQVNVQITTFPSNTTKEVQLITRVFVAHGGGEGRIGKGVRGPRETWVECEAGSEARVMVSGAVVIGSPNNESKVVGIEVNGPSRKVTVAVGPWEVVVRTSLKYLDMWMPHLDVTLVGSSTSATVPTGLVGFSVHPEAVTSKDVPRQGNMNSHRHETREFLAPGNPWDYLVQDGPFGTHCHFNRYRA